MPQLPAPLPPLSLRRPLTARLLAVSFSSTPICATYSRNIVNYFSLLQPTCTACSFVPYPDTQDYLRHSLSSPVGSFCL
ncbi:hypothetical protein BKA83DRAFT_4249978, partial [Pisolithus microcarpus]